jgi:hypothetical protein
MKTDREEPVQAGRIESRGDCQMRRVLVGARRAVPISGIDNDSAGAYQESGDGKQETDENRSVFCRFSPAAKPPLTDLIPVS